jgi:hypothetical protein
MNAVVKFSWLVLLLAFRPMGHEPLDVTRESARKWADPSHKARTWTATYRFFVPALTGTIVITVLTVLFRRWPMMERYG